MNTDFQQPQTANASVTSDVIKTEGGLSDGVVLHPAGFDALIISVPQPECAAATARGKAITPAMSQWVGIFRALMLVQVICFHHNTANDYKTFIPAHVFSFHPLTSDAISCNSAFFMFAQFFALAHFRKLAELSVGQFTLQFAKQYVKRYIQLRAAFLLLACGYESLVFCIFGEHARKTTIDALRGALFWKLLLVPYYEGGRHRSMYLRDVVGDSSWFVLELMNQESIFYIFYYAQHLLWRACKNEYVWTACYALAMLVVLTPCVICKKVAAHIVYAYVGNLLFLLRNLLTMPRPERFFTKLYARKRATGVRWVFCFILFYAWLVAGRYPVANDICVVFVFAAFALDLHPQVKLWPLLEIVVREINRLQMELYLLHSPFLEKHMPRGMPQLVPRDFEYLTPITLNWFVAWQLPLLFMQLSYPLWFLTKPIVEFVDWVDGLIAKKQKVQWPKVVFSLLSITVSVVLVVLQQCGIFGAGEVPISDISNYQFRWAQ